MGDNSPLHEHLRQLEESLLRPEIRQSPQAVGELLADNFVEFAGDGKIYNKRQIIDALQADTVSSKVQWVASDFNFIDLSPDVVLITYRARRYDTSGLILKDTLRSSLWRLHDNTWRIVFHQGTVAANP